MGDVAVSESNKHRSVDSRVTFICRDIRLDRLTIVHSIFPGDVGDDRVSGI